MKSILFSIVILFSAINAAADGECKDSNFDGLEIGESYSKLRYHHRFSDYSEHSSPMPLGLFGPFFGFEENSSSVCYHITAHYFTHKESANKYVMYTTHDDYCDGGNTIGLIVDMQEYQKHRLKEAIVAEIGDSGVYCLKK